MSSPTLVAPCSEDRVAKCIEHSISLPKRVRKRLFQSALLVEREIHTLGVWQVSLDSLQGVHQQLGFADALHSRCPHQGETAHIVLARKFGWIAHVILHLLQLLLSVENPSHSWFLWQAPLLLLNVLLDELLNDLCLATSEQSFPTLLFCFNFKKCRHSSALETRFKEKQNR